MVRRVKEDMTQSNNVGQPKELKDISLKNQIKDNETMFRGIFKNDETIVYRLFETKDSVKCLLIFTSVMIDTQAINNNILQPVMECSIGQITDPLGELDYLMKKIIVSDGIKKVNDVDELIGSILYGDTVLLVDGIDEGLLINTKGWQGRAIIEPSSERVVKGPREGFIESIAVNMSLIRRRINNRDLKFQLKRLGNQTQTAICICYIEGIVNEKILQELMNRLNKIDIDGIIGSNYIEEMIADSPTSPFKTTGYTERPDVAAGKLLEGRIAVIVDGTPVVVTVPYIFMEYFQTSEDYYDSYWLASINRVLRYLGFFLGTSVPAIYVALVTYHQEMVPTPLILSIASSREGVPFPTIFEALAMIIVFEIVREGGIRIPQPVGPAITIVGSLVIGQAGVEAKLASAPMIIVVALTGMAAFLIYPMKGAVIIIRLIFLILAGFLGLYGYIFGVIGLFIHLMSMRSFGIPYMLNIGSLNAQDIKDTMIRAPWWDMYYRPKLIGSKNPVRKSNADRKIIR